MFITQCMNLDPPRSQNNSIWTQGELPRNFQSSWRKCKIRVSSILCKRKFLGKMCKLANLIEQDFWDLQEFESPSLEFILIIYEFLNPIEKEKEKERAIPTGLYGAQGTGQAVGLAQWLSRAAQRRRRRRPPGLRLSLAKAPSTSPAST